LTLLLLAILGQDAEWQLLHRVHCLLGVPVMKQFQCLVWRKFLRRNVQKNCNLDLNNVQLSCLILEWKRAIQIPKISLAKPLTLFEKKLSNRTVLCLLIRYETRSCYLNVIPVRHVQSC
jgi:hypothetical protein